MIALIGLSLAILMAAFFSLAEMTIMATGRLRLRHWVLETMRGSSWMAADTFDRPYRLLTPILVGHTLAVSAAAAFGADAIDGPGRAPLVLAALTAVVVVPPLYLLGEIAPRVVAGAQAQQLFPAIARVLRACAWIFRPILALADGLTGLVLRPLGFWTERPAVLSRRSLEGLLKESERVGIVEPAEREIIAGVFDFGRTPVREVMTPAHKIVSAPPGSRVSEITELIRETGYSRIPLAGGEPGQIVGMVHVFDLFKSPAEDLPHPRPIVTTPPGKPCDELLIEMKRSRCHLAIVVEGDRTVGMVTLEDLVEELVGEIRDEHDSGG